MFPSRLERGPTFAKGVQFVSTQTKAIRETRECTVFVLHISNARLRQTYSPCLPAILHEMR
jgi:hypothetical protein